MTGFNSKRDAAADKLQDGKCKYCVDGCIACDARAQPVQKPVANSFEEYCKTLPPLWNTHISRTYAEQFFRAGQAAQPAQEPVAWTLLLTGEHHGIIGEAGEKFIGAPECYQRVNVYTTPPKREWIGLTDEEIHGTAGYNETREMYQFAIALMAKLKEKNT